MRGRLLLALLALVGATAFAPAPPPRERRAGKIDLKAITGQWVLVAQQVAGRPVREPSYRMEVEIKDGSYTYYVGPRGAPGTVTNTSVIILDATKTPCVLDMDRPAGGRSSTGVCALENDTLRICFTRGTARPASIEPTKPGEELVVLKRMKP
jgi:uncharacterized protein (TIGR03067 family)